MIATTPWVDTKALAAISSMVHTDMDVFEWGSGGSTVWFAGRARSVHSVEHDRDWFQDVSDAASHHSLCNVWMQLVCTKQSEGELPDWSAYESSCLHAGCLFDIVFVDGRSRVKCFEAALKVIKPGGIILLHDAERPRYAQCRKIGGLHYAEIVEQRSLLIATRTP